MPQMLGKKQGSFYSDFYNNSTFSQIYKKGKIFFKTIIRILFQISLVHKKSRTSKNKDKLNNVQAY